MGADGTVEYDAIIPAMLEESLPDIMVGVVIVLVLSASMSTLSSLVLTSSSTLTLDFLKLLIFKKMDDRKQLFVMRVLIVFFVFDFCGAGSGSAYLYRPALGISWGALAGAFLAPFLYGLFWKRTTKAAVWAAFICGVGITVANMYLNFFSSSIVAGAFSMLFGLVVVPVVSLLTPKPDEKKVDDIFFSMENRELYRTDKWRFRESFGGFRISFYRPGKKRNSWGIRFAGRHL